MVEKYYKVDREKRLIYLQLHYDKVEEILESDIGDRSRPSFKTELMSRIVEIINSFPFGYKANIEFKIKDYQGYDPDKILEAFNDEFELNHYMANKDGRGRSLNAAVLVFAAVIFVFLQAYLKANGYLGEGVEETAYALILTTLATLFIWEAGTVLFLRHSDYHNLSVKIFTRVNSLAMLNSDGKVVAEESKLSMVQDWVNTGRLYSVGNAMLSFFSAGLLVIGITNIFDGIKAWANYSSVLEIVTGTSLYSFFFVVCILASFAGFAYYLDRGKLRKTCGFFAVLFCLFMLAELAVLIYEGIIEGGVTVSQVLSCLFSMVFDGGYCVGYFILHQCREAQKKAYAAKQMAMPVAKPAKKTSSKRTVSKKSSAKKTVAKKKSKE